MTTNELLQEKDNTIRELNEKLQQMSEQIDELKKAVELYRQAAAMARAAQFGSRSEKTVPEGYEEQPLFNEAEQEASPKAKEPNLDPDDAVEVKTHKRKKRGSRDEMLKDIPHEEKICQLPEDKMNCDACGSKLIPVGKKHVRTEVQRIPAQLKIIDYYQMVYKCPECEKKDTPKMVSAPVPQPVLQHSMVSASAAAHLLLQKYQNAMPLYRQEAEWAELGLKLSRATMANWVICLARDYLIPLTELLRKDLLAQPSIHVDETPVQVLKEPGRKAKTKSYMWVFASSKYATDAHHIRLFRYNASRKGAVAKELLKDYHGYLHTDGYKGYNLVNGVTHCYCWVHLRRLFYQASKSTVESEGTLAAEALKMIRDLSNKEKAFADMSTEERQAAREKEETPIQEKFWQWIDANQGRCLPKSLLGKAFTYAQNQKDGLMNYLQYGNCDMTNNVAENSIRPFVVGRKNWEFSAAVKGAEASAAAYSIIETAKANGLDCRKYLTYLFEKLSQLDFRSEPDLFERFLPWQPEIQENCK